MNFGVFAALLAFLPLSIFAQASDIRVKQKALEEQCAKITLVVPCVVAFANHPNEMAADKFANDKVLKQLAQSVEAFVSEVSSSETTIGEDSFSELTKISGKITVNNVKLSGTAVIDGGCGAIENGQYRCIKLMVLDRELYAEANIEIQRLETEMQVAEQPASVETANIAKNVKESPKMQEIMKKIGRGLLEKVTGIKL
jgi:hypothetical protein